MDPFSLVPMQHLSCNHWPKERLIWNFIAKFGELWGNPRKYKSHTLPGTESVALDTEGLIHDLKSMCRIDLSCPFCVAPVARSITAGRFKINKLKSFSGVEIDQNHVDKRILGGKGLQYKSQEA